MSKISLGAFISAKRKALGKTQKDLANALGYTPQAISRLESSDGSLPVDLIPALCQFLDCSLDALFNRDLEGAPYDGFTFDTNGLGDCLTQVRKDAKLSQEEFSDALGISPKSLRKYEKNLQIPTFYVIERYCDFAGKMPSALLSFSSAEHVPAKAHGLSKKAKALIIGGVTLAVALGAGVPIGVIAASRRNNFVGPGQESSSSQFGRTSTDDSSSEPQSSSMPETSSSPLSSPSESSSEIKQSSAEDSSSMLSSEESSSLEPSSVSSEESSDEISSLEESNEESSMEESSEESSEEESSEESLPEEPKVIISDRVDADQAITLSLPEEKKTISMGRFPQSVVTDEGVIGELAALPGGDSEGTVLSYGGERYLAARSIVSFKAESGADIAIGLHYFRYDPIEWIHAADDDGGGHLFVTKKVLEIKPFTDHSVYKVEAGEELWPIYNNYEYSSIREYLNDGFYESAFGDEEKASILLTHVDNSLKTTIDNSNANLCNDTYDHVYLPSCNEMKLGGTDKSYRCASSSDYFKAMGGRYQIDGGNAFDGNGFYWLRSPYNTHATTSYVRVCSPIGMIYSSYDDDDVVLNASYIGDVQAAQMESGPYGIRPAMRLASIPAN